MVPVAWMVYTHAKSTDEQRQDREQAEGPVCVVGKRPWKIGERNRGAIPIHSREEKRMSVDNPYAAPEAELADLSHVGQKTELAGRFTRLAAAIVDSFIGLVYGVPILFGLGAFDYISRGQAMPVGITIAAGVLGFLGFLLVQGYFLKKNGQTIGKLAAGIRIADLDGNVPEFWGLILKRYVPISLAAQVPVIGPFLSIIDVLFIFRGDRRCVHDLIAGTKVVVARKKY
jgi:uncharacterized RDD family membrane protein YckC